MDEIRRYAAARGVKPATVLQTAAGLSGTVWAKWEAGTAACTMPTASRIRQYISDNPADRRDAQTQGAA